MKTNNRPVPTSTRVVWKQIPEAEGHAREREILEIVAAVLRRTRPAQQLCAQEEELKCRF